MNNLLEELAQPNTFIQQKWSANLTKYTYALVRGKKKVEVLPNAEVDALWHSHKIAGLGKIFEVKKIKRYQYRFYLPEGAVCPICKSPLHCQNLLENNGLPLFLNCTTRHKYPY